MAWTTPRTWVTSEVVPASVMNTHVRDNENFLRANHGCRLYKSGTQSVSSGNTDVISFNSEDYDTDAMHDNATNNSRITIPTGFDGFWYFLLEADIDADATQHLTYACRLRKNAAGSDASGTLLANNRFTGHTNTQTGTVSASLALVATDYVEAFFNSAGENRVLQSGNTGTVLTAFYLGQ